MAPFRHWFYHMTYCRHWLNTCKEIDEELVYIGSNKACKINEIGSDGNEACKINEIE